MTLMRRKKRPQFGESAEIKDRISDFSGYKDKFFATIARHFMGLCLKIDAVSLEDSDADKQTKYYNFALRHFDTVKTFFEKEKAIADSTRKIWQGFVYSNMAQCLLALGDNASAAKLFSECDKRQTHIASLLANGSDRKIYSNYCGERYIQKLRYLRCTGKNDDSLVSEIEAQISKLEAESCGYVWQNVKSELGKLGGP